MKKFLALALSAVLFVSLAACDPDTNASDKAGITDEVIVEDPSNEATDALDGATDPVDGATDAVDGATDAAEETTEGTTAA